jgi:hypothetical protein
MCRIASLFLLYVCVCVCVCDGTSLYKPRRCIPYATQQHHVWVWVCFTNKLMLSNFFTLRKRHATGGNYIISMAGQRM